MEVKVMQKPIACSRCRQGRPCLSHTRIPFAATCWVAEDELLGLADRRMRNSTGRLIRDQYGRYLVSLKNATFDECPLRYLDWLSGQGWLYGTFRTRLTAYLTHPCIERELETLFPDDNACIEGGQGDVWCSTHERIHHRWHGQA